MDRDAHLETRYKYELTPRQEEILGLMARDKTNAEIADALGLSLDGAKYHVREILAKLNVESREEAVAAWRAGRRPFAARLSRLVAPLAGLGAAKLAAGAAGVAVLAGTGVFAVAWLSGGNELAPPAAETPMDVPRTATPDPTAPTAGVTIRAQAVGCPVEPEICAFVMAREPVLRGGQDSAVLRAFPALADCSRSASPPAGLRGACDAVAPPETRIGFFFADDTANWIGAVDGDSFFNKLVELTGFAAPGRIASDGRSLLLGIGCRADGARTCADGFGLAYLQEIDSGAENTGTVFLLSYTPRPDGSPGLIGLGVARPSGAPEEAAARLCAALLKGCSDFIPWRPPRATSECPVEQQLCDLALRTHASLSGGDVAAVLEALAPLQYVCEPPIGQRGPIPICLGQPDGSIRAGYNFNGVGSDGGVGGERDLDEWIRLFLQAPAAGNDLYGPADLRIAGIGCGHDPNDRPDCSRHAIVLLTRGAEAKADARGRQVLGLRYARRPDGSLGISGVVAGVALRPFIEGGTTVVGSMGTSQPATATFYAWAPPSAGLAP